MCGRFTLLASGIALADLFDAGVPPEVSPRYNVAPTQDVLAVRLRQSDEGGREFAWFRWGLIPSWAKDKSIGSRLINARSETANEKPSFRAAFKKRRCLIPADGFYEWKRLNGSKQPLYIHPVDNRPFALAGLWESWRDGEGSLVETCTILTTTPNEMMAEIHNRMPVIIGPEDFQEWLDVGPRPDDALHLLRPYPAEKMTAHPVSTVVNNPRNDTPECIEPLA